MIFGISFALIIWVIAHIAIHEAGHAAMTLATGNSINGFRVTWRGFYLTHSYGSALQNVAVALAGPASNLVTYVILVFIHNQYAWLALWMALWNLLPFPDSDLLHALVYWRRRKQVEQGAKVWLGNGFSA